MKSLKVMLMSASAVGLIIAGSAAYAGDNNDSSIHQTGTGNQADINQSGGSNNDAGTTAYPTEHSYKLWQTGSNNTLSIVQTGTSNQIGVNTALGFPAENYTDSNGVHYSSVNGIQDGTGNSVTINQNGGPAYEGNQVGSYYQTHNYNTLTLTQQGTSSSTGSAQNAVGEVLQNGSDTLTITQTSDNSYVHDTYAHDGYANGNTIGTAKQSGTGNRGTITQTGNRNYVASLSQAGNNNTASVSQNGIGNRVDSLSQSTSGNSATVSLTGNYNGADSAASAKVYGDVYGNTFQTASFSGAAADAATTASVTQGTVTQEGGNYNMVSYTASGNSNKFGFLQNGGSNTITGSTGGDSNEAAVAEIGSSNLVNFYQNGNSNNLGVSIYGSGNNTLRNYFTGDAHSTGLTPGNLYQYGGSGNSILIKVGSSTTASNHNLFAATQYGSDNTLVGTISGGDYNQAAVTQIGSSNHASFTQTGSSNNVAVHQ